MEFNLDKSLNDLLIVSLTPLVKGMVETYDFSFVTKVFDIYFKWCQFFSNLSLQRDIVSCPVGFPSGSVVSLEKARVIQNVHSYKSIHVSAIDQL